MNCRIERKTTLIIICTFIIFTIVGTLSHEYGHILVAKYLGYGYRLHYASMDYAIPASFSRATIKEIKLNDLNILIGGPLQTSLTGLLGLLILYFRRRSIKSFELKVFDWLGIFLALFWLRPIFNLFISVLSKIIKHRRSYFGGDEKKISKALGLWEGSIPILFGFIGLLIAIFIVFKIVPKRHRCSFILAGLVGGSMGYSFWMYLLGPIILP